MAASDLSFLTFNIGNPSEQRAQRQLAWLAGRPEHVLVLTETKASAGCRLLASAFTTAGCHVTFPVPGPGEYGVMIISRVQAQPDGFGSTVSYLPTRAASVTLPGPGRADPGHRRVHAVPRRRAGKDRTQAHLADRLPGGPGRPRSRHPGDVPRGPERPRTRPPAALPVLRPVRVRLLPRAQRRARFHRRIPASAPGSGRVQLGRANRRRVPVRPRVLLRQSWHPPSAAASTCTSPARDGLSDHSALTAGLTVQPPPALAVSDPATATAPATLF